MYKTSTLTPVLSLISFSCSFLTNLSCFLRRSPGSYASTWYAWTPSTDAPSWIHGLSKTPTLRLPAGPPASTQTHSSSPSPSSWPTSRPSPTVIFYFSSQYLSNSLDQSELLVLPGAKALISLRSFFKNNFFHQRIFFPCVGLKCFLQMHKENKLDSLFNLWYFLSLVM